MQNVKGEIEKGKLRNVLRAKLINYNTYNHCWTKLLAPARTLFT